MSGGRAGPASLPGGLAPRGRAQLAAIIKHGRARARVGPGWVGGAAGPSTNRGSTGCGVPSALRRSQHRRLVCVLVMGRHCGGTMWVLSARSVCAWRPQSSSAAASATVFATVQPTAVPPTVMDGKETDLPSSHPGSWRLLSTQRVPLRGRRRRRSPAAPTDDGVSKRRHAQAARERERERRGTIGARCVAVLLANATNL